jgi:hypothetical protein
MLQNTHMDAAVSVHAEAYSFPEHNINSNVDERLKTLKSFLCIQILEVRRSYPFRVNTALP